MKQSPFTLIYDPAEEPEEPTKLKSKSVTAGTSASQNVVEGLNALAPALSHTLKVSARRQHCVDAKLDPVKQLKTVVKDLNRSERVVTVALWDLDARVSGLPQLIEHLNSVQTAFTFFDLRAPIPAGLVINSNNLVKWARKRLGKSVPIDERTNLENNFMFNDFHKFAKVVRERIGVDYLVGITQFMLAWEEGDEIYWNYFSTYDGRILMVSAFEMAGYAQKARRPIEVAIAGVAVAQLLQMLNRKIDFHDNGSEPCMFDFNEERESIVKALKNPRIEPDCLKKIDQPYRVAATKIVELFKDYSSGEEPIKKKTMRISKTNDEYWLKKLKTLSNKVEKGQKS